MRSTITLGLFAAALLLSACGDKVQTAGSPKAGSPPWDGAKDGYVVSGWKLGDRASWEAQLAARAQAQNEYSRIPAKP